MIDFDFDTTEKGTLVVRLSGRLDGDSNQYFFDCIHDEIGKGNNKIVITCTDLGHINSMGLSAMVRARSKAAKAGGKIYLAHLDATILDLLHLINFDRLLDIYATENEAIETIERV